MGRLRKVLYSFVVMAILVFTLTGCAKCIQEETIETQVKVIDAYHENMHLVQRYNPSTKGYYFVGIPATYEITVEYDGKPYIISDANAYDKYANKIGTDATGVLRIRKYDDGSVKKDTIGVK